jgi:hypothetical protein
MEQVAAQLCKLGFVIARWIGAARCSTRAVADGWKPASCRAFAGAAIHRGIAEIATGKHPSDKFRRAGKILGAIGRTTSRTTRVVHGVNLAVNETHLRISRDTGGIDANIF